MNGRAVGGEMQAASSVTVGDNNSTNLLTGVREKEKKKEGEKEISSLSLSLSLAFAVNAYTAHLCILVSAARRRKGEG